LSVTASGTIRWSINGNPPLQQRTLYQHRQRSHGQLHDAAALLMTAAPNLCVISNAEASRLRQHSVTVTAPVPPIFVTNPQNTTVTASQSATFTASASGQISSLTSAVA